MSQKKKVDESTALQKIGETSSSIESSKPKKPYEKPELICYGDVRDITLGPSPGFGESGAGVFFLLP